MTSGRGRLSSTLSVPSATPCSLESANRCRLPSLLPPTASSLLPPTASSPFSDLTLAGASMSAM